MSTMPQVRAPDFASARRVLALGRSGELATTAHGSSPTVHVGHHDPGGVRHAAIRQLADAAGLSLTRASRLPADVYHGRDARLAVACRVWIPLDDRPDADFARSLRQTPPGAAARLVNGALVAPFDWVRAAAYWLNLLGERNAPRDPHGRVRAEASELGELGRLMTPGVDDCARQFARCLTLAEALHSARPTRPRECPRWPDGKRYAVALTHDVDEPEVPPVWGEALRSVDPLDPRRAYWRLMDLARSPRRPRPWYRGVTQRREWDFDEYRRLEERQGLRSAFYFSVVHRSQGHHCDVAYDISKSRYRRLLRELRCGGWEIGLHAAYLTEQSRLADQVARLTEVAGGPIIGVRQHYLRLDERHPIATLTEQADAGLAYDSSIGFNDQPGFRAGTALPFHPYSDHSHSDFVELPMSLADMHLPRDDVATAVERTTSHLRRVGELGGLAVLNWHVGNWHAAPGWRESYRAACAVLAADREAWVARPADIADWWRKRGQLTSRDVA